MAPMRQSYIRVNKVNDHSQVSASDKMHLGSSSSAETLSLMLLVGLGAVCRSGAHDAYSKQLRSRREFYVLPIVSKRRTHLHGSPRLAGGRRSRGLHVDVK
jgi:hypothetical protein